MIHLPTISPIQKLNTETKRRRDKFRSYAEIFDFDVDTYSMEASSDFQIRFNLIFELPTEDFNQREDC